MGTGPFKRPDVDLICYRSFSYRHQAIRRSKPNKVHEELSELCGGACECNSLTVFQAKVVDIVGFGCSGLPSKVAPVAVHISRPQEGDTSHLLLLCLRSVRAMY